MNGWTHLALLLVCVACNTFANILLKSGALLTPTPWLLHIMSWRSFLGLAVFGIGGIIYAAALRQVSLGVAQSVLVLQYAGILFCSWLFFGEAFSARQLAGCALIIAGMLLMIQRA
ncbi:MAG: DMT family transporter [Desulfovibrio sp.]|uniref:EamA family transporter n=1 Tax=Desulfovibrio sp. TaxID=885 RepID=UPI0025C49DDF|nr:DMT family transporter [Desulfovibrio sp.]MCI7569093.1 DMT family transporter [Desulfovibrio sp.]